MSLNLVTFLRDEHGATAIEYGLIASLVAVAGIVAFTSLGDSISSTFTDIAGDFCVAVGGEFATTDEGVSSCNF